MENVNNVQIEYDFLIISCYFIRIRYENRTYFSLQVSSLRFSKYLWNIIELLENHLESCKYFFHLYASYGNHFRILLVISF